MMNLQETKEQLEQQLKQVEIDYHRIAGALALINDLIKQQENDRQQDTSGT